MGEEFLEVVDAAEAHRRFRDAVGPAPRGTERVPIAQALGRILAEDVSSPVDVPGFDRVNVDGFAVRGADTFGASEDTPVTLRLTGETIPPGFLPSVEVGEGEASRIATGGMLPRGADAVVMVEHVREEDDRVHVTRAVAPGGRIAFAGGDVARGEIVAHRGDRLSARETGTLAAVGTEEVTVHLRPRVAVISTGDEIIPPGAAMRPGLVYDSNQRIIADSLREIGCEAVELGIVPDDPGTLVGAIRDALSHDFVILSGGTSKGEGDHAAAAIRELGTIVCHGVAVKPGKPLCLAMAEETPVVVLPGFPTSAVFTFHEFVVPILLEMAGAPPRRTGTTEARVPTRLNTEAGRSEFILVGLLDSDRGSVAYPLGKGSGSLTSFSRADGFITVGRQEEFLEADESVEVQLLGKDVRAADLVVIGSHCLGLDFLLARMRERGFTMKTLAVGSQGGLLAAERGECDVAGIHLCDEEGTYNTPFLKPGLTLVPGYIRQQGIVFRDEEPPLATSRMVNRNRGSGTRVLIDELLGDTRPPGHAFEARSHHAVAAAVAQERADWGVAIANVAELAGLRFRELRAEHYDFVIPESRATRPAVRAFVELLEDPSAREALRALGFADSPR